MDKKRLIIVDAFAQIYRGFYAVRNPLTNSQGQPTNALLMLSKFLLKLEQNFPSKEGCFIFDCGKPQFRLDIAPDYKANRKPMPEELKAQMPFIEKIISAFGWNKIREENFEADDLIGAVAQKSECDEVLIITSDKDIHQLVNEKIKIMAPDKKQPSGFDIRDVASVEERFNISPHEIVDYLAMIGDSSDNIPGLSGIGPKTAEKLIKQFGSIKNMIANSDQISNKRWREKIDSSHKLLENNIKLVTLNVNVEEKFWKQPNLTNRTTPNFKEIAQLFAELELKSLFKELKDIALEYHQKLSDDDFIFEKQANSKESNSDDLFNFSEKNNVESSNKPNESNDNNNKHDQPDLFGF
ncbi:5'-3' exonuclease H3TH domain-containing protein [Lentisphaerota bacterium WC36G]|nr:hypothetical protein LJT99_06750 [Lentisphaerae bacterium WC36]